MTQEKHSSCSLRKWPFPAPPHTTPSPHPIAQDSIQRVFHDAGREKKDEAPDKQPHHCCPQLSIHRLGGQRSHSHAEPLTLSRRRQMGRTLEATLFLVCQSAPVGLHVINVTPRNPDGKRQSPFSHWADAEERGSHCFPCVVCGLLHTDLCRGTQSLLLYAHTHVKWRSELVLYCFTLLCDLAERRT